MSLRTQSDRLSRRGAAFRQGLAGIAITWAGKTYTCACTGIAESRELEAGGFEIQPDATLRINTDIYPAFTPKLGDPITIGTRTVSISKITPLPLSSEIKLELTKH